MTFREITPPLASKSTKKQASASTHENPQKTNKKTKTQQQKTNAEDGDQASGGKPKEQSETKKDGSAVIYQVGTDNIITEATQYLSNRLKLKHGEGNVVVVTKNKEGLLKIQGDTSKLKPGYKVKITGHIKGIGDKATMEGNTSEQLSEDLVTILPEGNSPRKVSVVGCGSGKCDKNNNSFASNLQKNLQKKDVITTVKGYSKDISMSVKGKVLQGEQASADKKMMEEGDTGDTEQVSDEERKRLNEKQQKEQQEKLNEELIDLVLELQKIEKQRKATEIPHRESYQKLEKVIGQLFQVKLDATEALGEPRLGSQFNETKNRLLAAQKEQLEVFNDISKRKNKIEEELQKFEDLFSSKYAEKLGGMKVLINDVEEEEKNIQEKWEEASKDIKESKKPVAESGEEDQQKEKLQTKLDKLTAQKNAIEQKKQALLIERMTVEMEMTQEKIAKLEVIIDIAIKAINRKKYELDALNIKIKKVQSLQLRYKNEVATLNKKITQIAQSQKPKRKKDLLTEDAKKDLHIAKSKEQNINSMLGLILQDKEIVISKTQKLLALDSQGSVAEIGEERDKALELEKTYQKITGNTENSLFDMVQEKIAIQGAFTRIENLSHSISEAEKDRESALMLIEKLNERIVQPELEVNKRANSEALRKTKIIYQLNADQEQRERIKEFREIEYHLKNVLGITTKAQDIESEKRENEFSKILENSPEFTKKYVKKEGIFPNLREQGNEALKRAITEEFEQKNTKETLLPLLNDSRLSYKDEDEYRNLILNQKLPIYERLDVFSRLEKLAKDANETRRIRADKNNRTAENLAQIQARKIIEEEQNQQTKRSEKEFLATKKQDQVDRKKKKDEKRQVNIKKEKERAQKAKERQEAEILEETTKRRVQYFLDYQEKYPKVFENAKRGQKKEDRNKEALRIKKEQKLKEANEQNQADKDERSKPVDLNKYGISFKKVKYRKWKKGLKKEKIRVQMFRRTAGDHHTLSKEINGEMKYMTVPVSPGADVPAGYINDMNLEFGISRATLEDIFNVKIHELRSPNPAPTEEQASASTDANSQKTRRKTKTRQQKTNDKDIGQASGGKPKEQSSATKKGGVVIYQVGTDDTITEATKNLSDRLKSKHGADNVVVVTKNNGLLIVKPDDIDKLKEGYKVKVTGHIKGIGDAATMEGNTPEQLSNDLAIILSNSKGNQASKVSVIGCNSDECDQGGNSFVSNLEKSLRSKGVTVPVKGYSGIVGVNDKGKVFEGEQVPVNKRMMEKEDAEQVPVNKRMMEREDAEQVSEEERKRLGGKKQKKEREERAQEKLDKELIDMEPQQQLGTFGIPQRLWKKVKTISWNQGVNELRGGMRHGWLKDLWLGEAHDRASGRKLFIDLFTDVIEISNVILEDISNRPRYSRPPDFVDDIDQLRSFFSTTLPSLDKRDLEELAQATSSMYKLISSKKTFLIARDAWKDHVQERKEMQLDRGGEAIILAGARHILSHKVDMSLYPMFNANAHPAYQYFNADKSVALVTGQSIQNNRTTDRGNDNAAPEYALWLKGKDKSMKNASLFVGQKTPMEKLFGDKISLLPKSLSDLEPPTKYESHIVIRDSYDKAAATVRREQVDKLHKKHNKEEVVVIEKMQNGKLVVTQGNIQNVKGEYKVHIIGHGHKDKYGTEILAGKDGKLMAQGIKGLEESIRNNSYAKLASVLLLNCCSATSGTWGANLVKDFKKAFNNESVKIKIKIRNNIDSEHQEKTILNEELLQDNKAPTDTKPQQQSSTLEAPRKPQNKPSAKSNNQTPNKKDGGVVIYKVGTDNIITEATNRLSARLKSKYGEDSVVLVTKNKDGSFETQGDINKLKDNYKVKITGHVKGIGDDATMEGNTQQQIATDLKTILPEHPPRKVSVTGCHSDKCDDSGTSFVSNLKESLQTKGVPTEVEGHKGYVGMNDEGGLMEGDEVPEDRRMMEKGDTGDTAEQEKIELEAEGIRLKKEQEKAELEAEGTRLKNEEEKIRNDQAEDRKALRLLEAELEKTRSKRLEDHRLLYKSIETLSEIDEDMIDTDINIKMLDAAKEFEASRKSRNYFAQQDILRQKTAQKIAVQRETEIVNTEKVITLDQQLSDKFNELMIKRVQLRGTIHKEAENTQKKLEKVREDIKKEEKQTQGLSAESDKTNKEKLKATLHALEKEMEAIEQKRQALMKENLLIQMMDAQRTHVNDELIKILFEETKKYREEEVKKWTDKKNALLRVYLSAPTKSRSNKVKKLEGAILHEEAMLRKLKGKPQRKLNNLKDMLKKEQRKLASKEDMEQGIKFISDLIDTATRGVRKLAIEEIEEKTNQIKNKESVLTKQNEQMDDLEKDFQSITANKEAQNTDHDNNTLREIAQQAIMRQEENEAIDELLE
ncbi:hypothetical protein, partial [uncultured Gammaproteobacteria bacterium]